MSTLFSHLERSFYFYFYFSMIIHWIMKSSQKLAMGMTVSLHPFNQCTRVIIDSTTLAENRDTTNKSEVAAATASTTDLDSCDRLLDRRGSSVRERPWPQPELLPLSSTRAGGWRTEWRLLSEAVPPQSRTCCHSYRSHRISNLYKEFTAIQ